ncbi:sensor histidine kinase [Paracoccus zhejiangensis]|uniref:sensor histidine kinase n=1 Tax=Paracoccus zhejiangensis TaxID=1077935 RepID=UPI001E5A14AF|nr:PAS domain S-box protein [Paracoccus zhejiangensis]
MRDRIGLAKGSRGGRVQGALPGDPWLPEGGQQPGRRWDMLSIVPLVAIIALVTLVAAVVWAVSRNETEQARIKLATDALWVEQTLRFQMSMDEDMLARLSLESAGGADVAALDARTRLHIANNPEILSVNWYDGAGQPLRVVPGLGPTGDPDLLRLLAGSARKAVRPVYGAVQPDGTVTMGLPLEGGAGFVTATTSLKLLLDRHVPWWIAEQYGARIRDAAGTDFATRQRVEPPDSNPSHSISFDPPLRGTLLTITAYDAPAAVRSALMMGAIAALASFAILALLVLFRNAARRRAAEARWRGETAFRRSMEESLTVGLRARDHDGRILYVNSAFCDLVGWEAAELVGREPPMPYWDPLRIEETEARHRKLEEGGPVQQSFESRFRHRDGKMIDVQVFESPLIDAAGRHRGWMGSIIDITEQKRAARNARQQDETLARTGRLVTLGEMASTLAHELNQPLSAIASYSAGMSNLLERPGSNPAMLAEANRKLGVQADRAGKIIRHIQDLVKKREPRFAPTPLDAVVAETVGFLAADAREHRVTLETRIEVAPVIEADRILLEQVLINLIRNGMEAMAETRSGDTVQIRLAVEEGQAVIEVTDRGAGISDEIAGRLFDAFASTKAQGMGMGLKICRSVAELHRGQLSFAAAPGGGTVFRVALPLQRSAQHEEEEGT